MDYVFIFFHKNRKYINIKMDYFMSKIGRGFRFTVSATAAIGCFVVMALGGLGITSIAIPICGGIAILPCILILVENTKLLRDLEKAISQLRRDLKEFGEKLEMLNETSESLKKENANYKTNNIELKDLIKEADVKIDELSNYLEEYKTSNKEFKKNLESSKTNLEELQKRSEELLSIKESYELKFNELNFIISKIQEKLNQITLIKEDYEEKIQQMEERNQELGIVSDSLHQELQNIKISYEKAKSVIGSLLNAKDVLEEVHGKMIKTVDNMEDMDEDLREKIKRYDELRDTDLFNQLDKDKDGNVDLDEFLSWYSPPNEEEL